MPDEMKPYTASGNLICPEFGNTFASIQEAVDHVASRPSAGEDVYVQPKQLDAYDQLNDTGELLYISPPCDVEPNGCA